MRSLRKTLDRDASDTVRLNPDGSFTLSLRPYECALLKNLLNDTRRSFTLKMRPYEHAVLENLLKDTRHSFALDSRGLDLGDSFTLTIRPYEYQLIPRRAAVLFAIFLPIHMEVIQFDQVKKTFVPRADHGISEFIRHDSFQKALEGHADKQSRWRFVHQDISDSVARRGVSPSRNPAQPEASPYLPNRKEAFRAVHYCCYGMALSLRQSSWVDLHMLERYLL